MAARLNPRNAESVRSRIQVAQLVKRLQDHALGEIEMTKTQIVAARFLINKRMPNPPEERDVNLKGGLDLRVSFV